MTDGCCGSRSRTTPQVGVLSGAHSPLSIAVDPEQGVLVTAPEETSIERIDRVVRGKAIWIVSRLRSRRALERPAPREFVSGETFKYLGRGYRLKVEHSRDAARRVVCRRP